MGDLFFNIPLEVMQNNKCLFKSYSLGKTKEPTTSSMTIWGGRHDNVDKKEVLWTAYASKIQAAFFVVAIDVFWFVSFSTHNYGFNLKHKSDLCFDLLNWKYILSFSWEENKSIPDKERAIKTGNKH